MAGDQWERGRCSQDDCIGIKLPSTTWCLGHAAEEAPKAFDAELKRIGTNGKVDARGVVISGYLLKRLLDVVPRKRGRPILKEAQFDRATFQGEARFDRVIFEGETRFFGATFQGKGGFNLAIFEGEVVFNGATFRREADFIGAIFKREARFPGATFQDEAWFGAAKFRSEAVFIEATFESEARFPGATFQDRALFDGASFQDAAWFAGASFQGDAEFAETRFEQPVELGPLAAAGTLVLDESVFDQPVQLQAAAWRLSCRRTRFRAGGHLRVAWAEITLEDSEIPAPLILSFQPPAAEFAARVAWLTDAEDAETGFPAPRPSLLSVQRADVAGLVVTDIDLRECHFAGSHHLDQLQLPTAGRAFHRAPAWHGQGRRVLAEECEWRQARGGWRARRWRHTTSELLRSRFLKDARQPHRSELAGVYRQLRKGLEDARNEPGAADFYYGECELRRHAETTPRVEKMILWCYWAVSGYGLRASRAVAAWAVLVVVGAAIFAGIGFKPPVSPQIVAVDVSGGQAIYEKRDVPRRSSWEQVPEALAFSAESTVSLLRAPDRALTMPGRWAQMVLRVLGPVLFGLAVLSLRGRVRR